MSGHAFGGPIWAAAVVVLALEPALAHRPPAGAAAAGPAAAAPTSIGIDLAGIDKSVAPGDDFFAYANGAWIKNTEIPADRSSWGTSDVLTELTARRTADLIAEAAKTKGHGGSDARKIAHFEESSAQLVRQYDGYRPFPDLAVNGKLTVSENIADVAGLAVAYDAYRLALGGKEAKAVQGITGDQQFFLSFARSWRQKAREAARRQSVLTDSHAPDEFRVATVRNLGAWYDAFAVKAGQALFIAPKDRVRVW